MSDESMDRAEILSARSAMQRLNLPAGHGNRI